MSVFGDVLVNDKLVPFERTERGISEERFDFLIKQIDVKQYYIEDGYYLASLSCEWVDGRYSNEAVWHAYDASAPN